MPRKPFRPRNPLLQELQAHMIAIHGSGPVKRTPKKPGEALTFGDRVREARKALKISQEALADRAGVSRRTVIRWELDRGTPNPDDLAKVLTIIHAHHADHAEAIAVAAGKSLAGFGLASPAGNARPAVPPDHVGDGIVAVAAEVLDASPRLVRPALVAALRRARALGLTIEEAERCLVARDAPA